MTSVDSLSQAGDLLAAGRPTDAAALLELLCSREPANARAWFLLGACRHLLQDYERALEALDRSLELEPGNRQASYAVLAVLCEGGKPKIALHRCEKLLRQDPGDAKLHFAAGVACEALGDMEGALRHYEQAICVDPRARGALQNRGIVLTTLGRAEEAVRSNRQFVEAYPEIAASHYNLAESCLAARFYDEAVLAADAALAIEPAHLASRLDRGLALAAAGRLEEARSDLAAVLAQRDPDILSRMTGWAAQADIAEEASAVLQPEDIFILLSCERFERCDWADFGDTIARCVELIMSAHANCLQSRSLAYKLQNLPVSPNVHRMLAEHVAAGVERLATKVPKPTFTQHPGKPKVRIGYLSANFGNHPTSLLTQSIYGLHDRTRFEVFGYSLVPDDGSHYFRRIAASCDSFTEVHRQATSDIAARIASDSIDILVDLNGYTRGSRSEILALRPAPVQAGYTAYPGTLGGRLLDYLIADEVVIPPGSESFYSEKIARLPHCYQPNSYGSVPDRPTPTRASEGLPERGFVFCAFHRHEKLDPQVFDAWMRILKSVPQSVLWLQEGDGTANLRRHAASANVHPERLRFARKVEISAHLARLRLAGLFLDTFTYNAHVNAADALWAGVPLVSRPGEYFVSRVAASLLRAIGLEELVVNSVDDYVGLAVQLATKPEKLGALRSRLERNRATWPLFDTARQVENLERCYLSMWCLHEQGKLPQSFSIDDGESGPRA